MIASRDMHHFHRHNYLVVTAAAVDEAMVQGQPVEVVTFMLRSRNGSGAEGQNYKYQVPVDSELGQDLLGLIKTEQGV